MAKGSQSQGKPSEWMAAERLAMLLDVEPQHGERSQLMRLMWKSHIGEPPNLDNALVLIKKLLQSAQVG